jgi:TonB family protein
VKALRPAIVALGLLPGLAAAAPALPGPDGAATATQRVPPQYPKAALDKKLDGCVVLSFTIDAEGRPAEVKVEDSQPAGAFDAATLATFPQWRFEQPPRPGRYAQAVNYRLEKREPVNTCIALPSFAALNPDAVLTRELRVLRRVMPAFDRAGDGGCVTVRFQIKYDGFVGDVKVLEARPESLAQPTIDAVKQWHFQSFPPPDLYTTQTFNFTPEQVRMPESMIRAAYADLAGGELRAIGCGGKPAAKAVDAAEGKP